jgi:hypothetical protein
MTPSNRTALSAPRDAIGPTRLRGKPFGPAAESSERVNQQGSAHGVSRH